MKPWIKRALGAGCASILLLAVLVGLGLRHLSSLLAPAVAVGQPLPAVELRSFEGMPVRLEDYHGRPVVVEFWSST